MVLQTKQSATTLQKCLWQAQEAKAKFCQNIWQLWKSPELDNKKSHDIIYTTFVEELYSEDEQQEQACGRKFIDTIHFYGVKQRMWST